MLHNSWHFLILKKMLKNSARVIDKVKFICISISEKWYWSYLDRWGEPHHGNKLHRRITRKITEAPIIVRHITVLLNITIPRNLTDRRYRTAVTISIRATKPWITCTYRTAKTLRTASLSAKGTSRTKMSRAAVCHLYPRGIHCFVIIYLIFYHCRTLRIICPSYNIILLHYLNFYCINYVDKRE